MFVHVKILLNNNNSIRLHCTGYRKAVSGRSQNEQRWYRDRVKRILCGKWTQIDLGCAQNHLNWFIIGFRMKLKIKPQIHRFYNFPFHRCTSSTFQRCAHFQTHSIHTMFLFSCLKFTRMILKCHFFFSNK